MAKIDEFPLKELEKIDETEQQAEVLKENPDFLTSLGGVAIDAIELSEAA